MIAAFPAEERYGRGIDLIELTRAIVWQRLVPTNDGKRLAIREWLVFDREIREELLLSDFE